MSIIFNTQTLNNITFNGVSLTKVIYNSVTVFNKTSSALVPVLTSDSSLVIKSGQYSTLYAWKVFDGKSDTRWHQAGGGQLTVAYIGYNFNEYKTVTKVYIMNSCDNEKSPHTFKLQGSNDLSTWNDIQTFTNTNSATKGVETTFTVTSPKMYKAFRLYMDKSNLNSFKNDPNGVSLSKIQFYGY